MSQWFLHGSHGDNVSCNRSNATAVHCGKGQVHPGIGTLQEAPVLPLVAGLVVIFGLFRCKRSSSAAAASRFKAGRSEKPTKKLLRIQYNTTVHELHETCHSVTFYFMIKDSKRCCDTTTPESIHTKDESKRDSVFAIIFGVN